MELNLCDGAAPGDVLGLWESDATAAAAPGALSFDIATPTDAPALWQVNLPDDFALAASRLSDSETNLQRSQQLLAATAGRLERLEPIRSDSGVSFAVGADPDQDLLLPERELLALLQGQAPPGEAPVSFGIGADLAAIPMQGWEQGRQAFQALMERLRQSVADSVLIETRIEGRLLGRTIVNWASDVQTVWPGGKTVEEVMLHQRTVALALKSRETTLKMFAASVQMAISLASRLALPGGPLLALPAVLRFIKQMLELQSSPQPI